MDSIKQWLAGRHLNTQHLITGDDPMHLSTLPTNTKTSLVGATFYVDTSRWNGRKYLHTTTMTENLENRTTQTSGCTRQLTICGNSSMQFGTAEMVNYMAKTTKKPRRSHSTLPMPKPREFTKAQGTKWLTVKPCASPPSDWRDLEMDQSTFRCLSCDRQSDIRAECRRRMSPRSPCALTCMVLVAGRCMILQ